MNFEFFIARRYLSSRGKPLFVSFLLYISIGAVATGVFALIFVLSVMNGFENDFRQRILGFKAPLSVLSQSGEDLSNRAEEIKNLDERIQRVSPYVEGEAVIQSEAGGAMGVRVRGITGTPHENRLGKIYQSAPFVSKSLLIGEELAASLHVHPDFEETIRLIFPLGDVGPTGDLIPRVRPLTLTGMFRSGFYEYDNKYVLIPYREALILFGEEGRTGLEIWVEPVTASTEVKKKIEAWVAQGGQKSVSVQTWRDQSPKLFAAMELEKIGMLLLLSALLLIASFNIFGLSSLTVMEKTKDMAVLRSLGLTRGKLRRIFLLKAAGIGLWGGLLGGALSLGVVFILKKYPIPLPATYYLQHLPVVLKPLEAALVLVFVPLLTTLAALYPALQASRPSPVEVFRYE